MGILSNLANIGRRVDRLRDQLHKMDPVLHDQCKTHLDDYENRVLRNTKDWLNDPNENEVTLGTKNGKIPAIKAYRERTGVGLVEAKQIMEAYFDKKGYTFYYAPAVTYSNDRY